jgi:two-component system response regulator DesR
VLLIDDHRVFADVLRLGIDAEPDLHCVGTAHSAAEGLALAATSPFAVAVVDLELADASGIDVTRGLLELRPDARVIILTAHVRPDLARRAVAAGASGFIGKDTSLRGVLAALRTATPQRPVLAPELDRDGCPVALTPREHDVLRRLGQGLDAPRIAAALGISLNTTRDHIKTLIRKLGAHNQLGAVVEAQRLGLLTVGRRY